MIDILNDNAPPPPSETDREIIQRLARENRRLRARVVCLRSNLIRLLNMLME